MNIYKHEFKTKLRSVIIWSISQVSLLLVFLSLSSSFAENTALLTKAMANFPKELLIAFGMTDFTWSSILGFYGLVFLFCQICLAIQAANYGFALVSIEETELTADFLLAKPVGRPRILTNKLLAALTSLTLTNAVVWISSFAFLHLFDSGNVFDVKPLVMLLLSILVFQLFFLSVGILISLLVKRVRNVTPFSMALVFGLYILNAFGSMIGSTSLEVISPFKQFEPNYILKNAAYDYPLVILSMGIIIISVVGSYVLYSKRNIPSVV
jgi:ABC-2 type transport system permease protein